MESAAPWGTKKELAAISESLNKMTKFTDKGIGVVTVSYTHLDVYKRQDEICQRTF